MSEKKFNHDIFFDEISKNLTIKDKSEIMDKTELIKMYDETLFGDDAGWSEGKEKGRKKWEADAPPSPEDTIQNKKIIDYFKLFTSKKSDYCPNVSIFKAWIRAMNFKVNKKEEQVVVSYMRHDDMGGYYNKVNKDLIKILETFSEFFEPTQFEDEYRSVLSSLSKHIEIKRIADINFFNHYYDIGYHQYFDLLINKKNEFIYLTSYYWGEKAFLKDYFVHCNFDKNLDEKKMVSMVYQKIIEGDNQPPESMELSSNFDWKISDLKKLNLNIETFE
jgi:hypothetical protein|tara:strand:+ start:29 stop:856 length:828 start_codon:yes stop_codon:yes gene_type:complete